MRERESKQLRRVPSGTRLCRFATTFFLIFSLLLQNSLFLVNPVFAATSPWTQTDWSGGSGQTSWSDTTKFDSSSTIDTSTTSGEASLSVAEKLTNTGFDSDNSSWSVAAVPSSGWVEVPGNATFSTTNFLAMKYEAKCAATSDPTTGLTSPDTGYNTYSDSGTACTAANSKQVVSVASGYPIANISHTNALTRCSAVSLNGNAVHLMRNDEWMTVARDAEAQAGNWSLGSVGSGYLFAGHNDNVPAKARIASTTDTGNNSCAYTDGDPGTEAPSGCPTNTAAGTSGTAGNQVRTFTLSNGAVIWDIAGNVWEHVMRDSSDTLTTNLPTDGGAAGWRWIEHTAITDYGELSYDIVRPLGSSYNANYGVGRVYTYNGSSSNRVFVRGGNWSGATTAGAFTLDLGWGSSNTGLNVGFRCASDPVAISQSFSSSSGRAGGGDTITIGSISDGKIYQSVNVGDTSTYDFSAYVYDLTGTEGEEITSSDAQLYYNGSTISTTYTNAGSGWWKLSGTLTGANASREYGVLVKAGKTVKTDDFSLSKEYNASGTLTSSIFDSEFAIGAAWGTLTYTSSGSTAEVKARTSNSSSMTGAADFSSCTAITSGSDISSNSCVTDGHRYIQYQLALSTSDTSSTPTFSDISIAFAASDADAPSISLTALSPDPNSDNTPTLSGTATESIGTVSNVQYQMDGTGGSWTACTADDGAFDEATEAFTCAPSALSDGSHTMYVRATDSNANTTSNANASTDSFTIDTTAPVSFDLQEPGNNSYTNNERPAFKWKAASAPDATSGLNKYVLEIDMPSGDLPAGRQVLRIDSIPTTGTTDVTNNKYVIHFEGFSDSDSSNNYISVYTRSTSSGQANSWGSSENDGKLREGKISWKVKAVDNAGNERTETRTLFVDRTSPNVEFTQINDLSTSEESKATSEVTLTTTDTTPSIYGKITDSLAGGDSSQTQDENGPKIASGPKQVDIKVEKKEGLGYKLITLYTINMDKPWWTCNNKEITDNSKQQCDPSTGSGQGKYLPFEYTSKENLELGTYKITLTGKDKADNSSSETTLSLNITTLAQITTLEEKEIIEEALRQAQGEKPLKPEEQEKVKEELEITKPVEPSALEKAQTQISQTSKNVLNTTGNIISAIFNGIGNGVRFTVGTALNAAKATSNTLTALYNGTQSILAYVGQGIGSGVGAIGQGLAFAREKIGKVITPTSEEALRATIRGVSALSDGYNQLANNAPGVGKTILTGIGNGVGIIVRTAVRTAGDQVSVILDSSSVILDSSSVILSKAKDLTGDSIALVRDSSGFALRMTGEAGIIVRTAVRTKIAAAQNTTKTIGNIASSIAGATQNKVSNAKKGVANLAFTIGEKTEDISHSFGTTIIKIGYLFVPEPTKISNVNTAALSPTSVKIAWTTNHPANGKVNYGFKDGDYDFEEQTDKRTTFHEFVLTNLTPDTEYHYEVMSQNRNYVYDANRKFKTPAK